MLVRLMYVFSRPHPRAYTAFLTALGKLQAVPNNCPPIHVPTAGPSRLGGNPNVMHSGMSVGQDLKNFASYHLHHPSSFIDKLRMREGRSGTVKVFILLGIIDESAAI